jgi:hypothetical protein
VLLTSDNQITTTLLRNTPYSWFVLSKSNSNAAPAKSEVWKFYNSGPVITSHAPYPAEITSPSFAQNVIAANGKINLTWVGSDADGDISDYDIHFGTETTPPLLLSKVKNMFLNDVTVAHGRVYYWKVLTKDSKGNTSESVVSQFKVN